jgi:hypothetical protein
MGIKIVISTQSPCIIIIALASPHTDRYHTDLIAQTGTTAFEDKEKANAHDTHCALGQNHVFDDNEMEKVQYIYK